MGILAGNFLPLLAHTERHRTGEPLMTETHSGSNKNKIATVIALDTNHANAFVTAGVEKCWSRFDDCGDELHDVFIVISEGSGGEHIARTVYAADLDDARQTHQENYADEPIVAVHQ